MTVETRSDSSPRHEILLPDRYQLVRRIATGGMASVWAAYDSALDRRVAIKLLGEQFADAHRSIQTQAAVNKAPAPQPTRSAPPPARHLSATTVTEEASTSPPTTVSAQTLETRGHELMRAGSYGAAVGVLRQAVRASSPSSLTYAYALFDLGRTLRLAGDPAGAIPILRARLAIPNQTGIVRQELTLALRALARYPTSGGAPATPSAAGHGRGGKGSGDHGNGAHGDRGD